MRYSPAVAVIFLQSCVLWWQVYSLIVVIIIIFFIRYYYYFISVFFPNDIFVGVISVFAGMIRRGHLRFGCATHNKQFSAVGSSGITAGFEICETSWRLAFYLDFSDFYLDLTEY